jgi:hypothetical protein
MALPAWVPSGRPPRPLIPRYVLATFGQPDGFGPLNQRATATSWTPSPPSTQRRRGRVGWLYAPPPGPQPTPEPNCQAGDTSTKYG